MTTVNITKKKTFSNRRFAIELFVLFIFLFIIDLIFKFDLKYFSAIVIFFICYSFISIIFPLLIIPFKFLFNIFFSLIAKITNPILITLCYILGIVPFGICYKFYTIFLKKKIFQESYWREGNISVKNIDMDEQY
jgi:hypothetical protein